MINSLKSLEHPTIAVITSKNTFGASWDRRFWVLPSFAIASFSASTSFKNKNKSKLINTNTKKHEKHSKIIQVKEYEWIMNFYLMNSGNNKSLVNRRSIVNSIGYFSSDWTGGGGESKTRYFIFCRKQDWKWLNDPWGHTHNLLFE